MFGFDKVLHFGISFLLALVNPVVSAVAGIGKEIFDEVSGGMANFGDLFADAMGIVLALLII